MTKLEKNHFRGAKCCLSCKYSSYVEDYELLFNCDNNKNFKKNDLNRRVMITNICDLYEENYD